MKVIKWHEEIRLVDGFNRSCIYDLPRNNYYLVPKELAELKSRIEGQQLSQISKKLNPTELDWINYLFTNEFIFEVEENIFNNFEKIELSWASPVLISNIMAEFGVVGLTKYLNYFNTKHVLLFIKNKSELDQLEQFILNTFIGSTVQNIDLCLHFKSELDLIWIKKISPIIGQVFEKKIDDFYIEPLFLCNITFFNESSFYNTFLNRKLYIDIDGNCSNHPGLEKICNLSDIDITLDKQLTEDIISTRYWNMKKDDSIVCSHCEFRNMCFVDILPQVVKNETWVYPLECTYNPFISKWKGEENYKTLSESGLKIDQNGLLIDEIKLAELNKEIWDE